MSDSGDVQQLAEQLAAQGREVLVEQLRGAYADAALAHADVVSIDQSRIDSLVQRAADRADGLQWRRALASAASERLGISVVEALGHPAVAKAQELADAPSYEDSLSKLLARPVSAPKDEPLPTPAEATAPSEQAVLPSQEKLVPAGRAASSQDTQPEPPAADTASKADAATADETAADDQSADDGESYVPAEQEAAAQFTPEEVAQADAPTQTYNAAQAAGAVSANEAAAESTDGESTDGETDDGETDDEQSPPSPLAGLAKAKPVVDPHATQVHDMAAEFAAQDRADATAGKAAEDTDAAAVPAATQVGRTPQSPQQPRRQAPPQARPDTTPDSTATYAQPAQPPASAADADVPPRRPGAPARPPVARAPEPAPYPEDVTYGDELRVAAVHLGGVANLPSRGEPLDLRISEAGLDILQANEEILGRLQWSDIGRLEAGSPKGRLLGKGKSGSRLVVRTKHGDASFEIPDMSPEDLRAEVAELSARYGR